MNADGQRHALLLGAADWGRCLGLAGAPIAWGSPGAPGWDEDRSEVTLAPRLDLLPPNAGDTILAPALRRAAAADANGNIYFIGADAARLFVRSAGDNSVSPFWPDPRVRPAPRGIFAAKEADSAPAAPWTALAATDDGWLVAATAAGLHAFDLVAGGPPLALAWSDGQAPVVTDLEPACGDGLWLLGAPATPADAPALRLYRLNAMLSAAVGRAAPEPDLFQPETGPPRTTAPPEAPAFADLSGLAPGINPIAIAAMPDGSIAVLSRSPDLVCLWREGAAGTVLPLDFAPHDMVAGNVLLRGGESAFRLMVAGGSGNQARAFKLVGDQLVATPETFPLRRYGGRALLTIKGQASYDSGPVFVRMVEQPRQRYQPRAAFLTPVFDAGQPGAVWDRLRIDGCVPPGARITVAARCGDDAAALGPWQEQPGPLLSRSGSENPAHSRHAIIATDVAAGRGTHELLCQRIEGQHMQLRITLASDGDVTPRLRALRASWPRQSWAQRYLPGVYLEAPEPADFLTRYLSNMQGITSRIEAAIIAAEHLLDTRTAPQEALPWLAGWFDVALDPAWGEARSRAFIAHAVTFFGWRGTMKGVESALALAFGQPLGGTLFGSKDCRCEGAIRIVETFRTRRLGRIGAGDSSSIADAEIIDPGLAEQGAWRAFQTGLGRSASAAMASLPRLSVPGGHAQDWAAFLLRTSPARQYWQRFLTGRYRRIDALNDAHGSGWNSFGEVALNDAAAATAAGRADWGAFTAGLMPIARTAHRFSVLLPVGPGDATDAETLEGRRRLAARIVDLEKPAHTIFDVRFYFAMNRIGEARLGMDTTLGAGSRSADTLPPALLGRAWLGESFVGPDGPALPDGADLNASRTRLSC